MASASAQIGISVESMDALSGLAASASSATEASSVSTAQEFSQKVIESLLNYSSSFALSPEQARMRTSETFVPFSGKCNRYNFVLLQQIMYGLTVLITLAAAFFKDI